MRQQEYLAHISEDGRTQTVLEHLEGTAKLAGAFARPFGAAEQGAWVGMLHDIGKYSDAFQRRLHGGESFVDHATAGAYESMVRGQIPAAFCIAGHHGGIPDGGGRGDTKEAATLMGRCKRAPAGELPDYQVFRDEITLTPPKLPPFCGKEPLTDVFFTRMLFSCLVDADFLDTERFMTGGRETNQWSMDTLEHRLLEYVSGWFPPKSTLNARRCQILEACLERGREEKPGLFTLTVPTGGGKTVASLAFALRHANRYGKKRVIYVIPYTSIIEQTASIFREILGEACVLEHHAGVVSDIEQYANPQSIRLAKATENWDMPVIVTTAVQFFESLYSSRPSKCRKLHNLADSVIVFDEAQMLPVPYLQPCVHAIAQLVAHYGVSAVLCTATQPALKDMFSRFLPGQTARELCPPGVFEDTVFRRVRFQNAGRLDWETLCSLLNRESQVLCIVNSRKAAERVFSGLKGEGIYHLSTLMYPAHRRSVLEEIRGRLKAGLPCRVVSTSLIEAGVDVDFPKVFRELAGLDSILQAAGRCNREGKRDPEDSIVTVFQAEDKAPPMFAIPIGAAEEVLAHEQDISSQSAIRRYFLALLDLKGSDSLDQKKILKRLQGGTLPFRSVAEDFHLIESGTKTIYIPAGEGAELVDRFRCGDTSRGLFRRLGQYGVSVYEKHFGDLLKAGDLEMVDDDAAILTNPALYDPKTGLSLEADFGKALFV